MGSRKIPFDFVLDELSDLEPVTKAMFGCTAVYLGPRIVFILREKGADRDDGVWVATLAEHHTSLRAELPSLRSIAVFGPGETAWQIIPADDPGFEDQVLRACSMARKGDPRVGKIPAKKRKKRGE